LSLEMIAKRQRKKVLKNKKGTNNFSKRFVDSKKCFTFAW